MNPDSGRSIYWRWLNGKSKVWLYGYVTALADRNDLIRLGSWNGDSSHGIIVDPTEIEWRYK